MEAALEAGAEDLEAEEGAITVLTEVVDFHNVQEAFRGRGMEWESAELAMIPKTMIRVEGKEAERLLTLLEKLEDADDVQKVHTNADIDEEVMAAASGS